MHRTWNALLATLALASGAPAQAVSTATATQPLVVTSSATGSLTFPPGPVPATGLSLNSPGTTSVWAKMSLGQFSTTGFPGGTAWFFSNRVNVDLAFFGSGTASLNGQVRLHFRSPQPVTGLLYMWPYFFDGFPGSSGDITVDLDCDGTPDYSASTQSSSSPAGTQEGVEVPMTLDSTGRWLCVDMNLSGSLTTTGWNRIAAQARAAWQIVFLPGTYGLERHGTGCVPIFFGRSASGNWRSGIVTGVRSTTAPAIVAGYFLVGLAGQNTPLGWPPNCPLLVANPVLVPPDILGPRVIGWSPPDLLIPPGVRFYCQGIWLDAQGDVFTSDSIRTM